MTFAFFQQWLPLWIGLGVVVVAALVNRFAPQNRRRIRRVVILFALYLAGFALAAAMKYVHEGWSSHFHLAAELFEAFTLVNLLALLVFDLLLPAIRIDLVSITSDIIVGIAYFFATLGVLRSSGMDPSSLLTTSAVVGAALTLSLQSTLVNLLGGVALQLDGSIHVGDWLQLENGKQGQVKEIRWRHTVVETRDWDTIIVPNNSLLAGNIMILGKRRGQPVQHRMWVYFTVDFRYAPTQVIQVVEAALREAPIQGVARNPPPNCIAYDFSKDMRESMGYYAVRYWLTDLPNDDPTSSRVRARIYSALRRAQIPLARPVQTVFFAPEEEPEHRAARHRERRLEAMKRVDLFKSLTEQELEFLSARLLFAPFTAGETVTRKGAVAHWLYVLTKGSVDVMAIGEGGGVKVVATIDAPGFFGEMGLMTGEARSADVIARTDIECYRLDKAAFEQILSQRREIAKAVSETLARRRVELEAIREGLDAEARRSRELTEQNRILERIQSFFGLEE